MNTAILLLAVAGFAAVAVRTVLALLAALRARIDVFLAREIADTRAQRGDLTGVADAQGARVDAWRRWLIAIGYFFVWAGLLLIPSLTPWPSLLYAGYSLLWLVPRRRRAAVPRT